MTRSLARSLKHGELNLLRENVGSSSEGLIRKSVREPGLVYNAGTK
jgi:hypothetical protein